MLLCHKTDNSFTAKLTFHLSTNEECFVNQFHCLLWVTKVHRRKKIFFGWRGWVGGGGGGGGTDMGCTKAKKKCLNCLAEELPLVQHVHVTH